MQDTSSREAAVAREAGRGKETVLEQAGGVKGVVYSALPALVFVVANGVGGLKVGILAALLVAAWHRGAAAGAQGVDPAGAGRRVRRSRRSRRLLVYGVRQGLLPHRHLGEPGGAVAFVVSVVVRWPLAGLIWNATTGKGVVWRADGRSRLYYDIATLVLAVIFGARFAVQQYLYQADEVGSLGFAKIAMGYPLLALGVLVVAWAARASDKRLKVAGLLPAKRT